MRCIGSSLAGRGETERGAGHGVLDDLGLETEDVGDEGDVDDVAGSAGRVDAPVAHGDELVGVAAGLVDVVQHHHDGPAALGDEAVEQVEHVDLVREIEERRRLVEQQQLGLLRERHRDPRALALAAGQLVERAAAQVGHVRSPPAPPRPPPRRRPTSSEQALVRIPPARGEVLDRQALGRDRRLRQQPEPARDLACDGSSEISRPSSSTVPAARLQQPRERAQQRRLAAAVGADDRGDPLRGTTRSKPVDDVGLAVADAQAACLEAAHRRRPPQQVEEVRRRQHRRDDPDRDLVRGEREPAREVGHEHEQRRRWRRTAPAGPARSRARPSRREMCGATNATKPIGPAAATAIPVRPTASAEHQQPRALDAEAERARDVVAERQHVGAAPERVAAPGRAPRAPPPAATPATSRGRSASRPATRRPARPRRSGPWPARRRCRRARTRRRRCRPARAGSRGCRAATRRRTARRRRSSAPAERDQRDRQPRCPSRTRSARRRRATRRRRRRRCPARRADCA